MAVPVGNIVGKRVATGRGGGFEGHSRDNSTRARSRRNFRADFVTGRVRGEKNAAVP